MPHIYLLLQNNKPQWSQRYVPMYGMNHTDRETCSK